MVTLRIRFALPVALALLTAGPGRASDPPAAEQQAPAPPWNWAPEARVVEPKAAEILKAMSARLARARTLSFTAVIADESPSRLGPPLLHASRSTVALQRPDRLRVVTTGGGPPTEFFVSGTRMSAYVPSERLLATATVPPTLDGALEAAHQIAHVYWPFADLVTADPYRDLEPQLRLAFVVGQSQAIGGTTTDIVAYATDEVFVQAWIGVADHLPRRMRAIFLNDAGDLRHEMELSDWKVDPKIPASTFELPEAARKARPMPFERPK